MTTTFAPGLDREQLCTPTQLDYCDLRVISGQDDLGHRVSYVYSRAWEPRATVQEIPGGYQLWPGDLAQPVTCHPNLLRALSAARYLPGPGN
jgi:hypothetical protein